MKRRQRYPWLVTKYEETTAIPMAPAGESIGIEQPLPTPRRRLSPEDGRALALQDPIRRAPHSIGSRTGGGSRRTTAEDLLAARELEDTLQAQSVTVTDAAQLPCGTTHI